MGRLHPTMNLLTTFIFVALQEPAEGKPLHPLIATTIFLVGFGVIALFIKNEESGKPSELANVMEGCFGCLGAILKFILFLAFIALVLFGIIKAVKYAWFF